MWNVNRGTKKKKNEKRVPDQQRALNESYVGNWLEKRSFLMRTLKPCLAGAVCVVDIKTERSFKNWRI